jgi:hypothetical protein
MRNGRLGWPSLTLCVFLAGAWVALGAQSLPPKPGELPGVEPLHDSGQDVTPGFEGWYKNPDGTFNILFGYNNRNLKQELDIPIGPNNQIMPGGPDRGQPTHFNPRRGWGMFTVTVPKDFGEKSALTWTLTINGRTNAIPARLDSRWEIDALKEATSDNTPPVIKFSPTGPSNQGPKTFYGPAMTANVGKALPIEVFATDDGVNRSRNYRGPKVTTTWSKYRGPGKVTFEKAKEDIEDAAGKAATTATFDAPGEYWLRVVANDSSGDGGRGFQCCWTNGVLKVTVRP